MFEVGCCCCKNLGPVGYVQGVLTGLKDCFCKDIEHITNIGTDNSDRIAECRLIFAGPQNNCGDTLALDTSLWATVKDWLEAGGRLYVNGEYSGCISPAGLTEINAFLTFLGSTMQIGDKKCNCLCAGLISGQWVGMLEAIPLLENVDIITHACTNEVTGGTVVAYIDQQVDGDGDGSPTSCITDVPYAFISVEQIGDGFLLVSGDSNLVDGCGTNCDLWQAFYEKDEIL
jgi:hypothetical protein